ncbi:MAG: D-aminoacylase [Candidatus Didemnitutus sp.]|nr:D-aminoacylase [Candidatus Didemnitutus sp.]
MQRLLGGVGGLLAAVVAGVSAFAADYDVVITGGRVVDGTGAPAFVADVAIKDAKIVQIGAISGSAEQHIDARGLVVAPGFIDVHTHSDDIADKLPTSDHFLKMGVTSIVVGNCGSSRLNVAQFFSTVEKTGVSPNVATLVGHNTVREKAMRGVFDRQPTAEELAEMKHLVDRAMQDGAVGLSTGLIYLPGRFSETEEIVELAKVIAPYDGIYASHMRNEGSKIISSIEELLRIAREAQVRAQVSHLKLSGENAWGRTKEVLALLDRARAEGIDVAHDQYAYTASSTQLRQLIPGEAFDGGRKNFLAVLADPKGRADLVAKMKKNILGRGRMDYAYAVVASFRGDATLNGLNIVEAARKLHGSDSIEAQIEVILEIERRGGAAGVFHGMDEQDLQVFMQHPKTMIASDSGVREFGEDVPHPRGYGNNARVLGRYVRELEVLTLEDAVRKMTSLPARHFQFSGRGELKVGAWADVAIFAAAEVTDPSTYKDPHHYAVGFRHVLVNGVAVIRDGEHTGAKPGMVLRHAKAGASE